MGQKYLSIFEYTYEIIQNIRVFKCYTQCIKSVIINKL